jgi:DNA modification methylase
MIHKSLSTLAVPVDSLSAMPGNPRIGDVDAVAASLDRFGQRKPIVVRASDRTIIAGNHTWKAAQQLGWSEIAALLVDDDEATGQAFALADNRTAELGSYDEQLLLELIRSVAEADPAMLLDTGWSDEAITELVERIEPSLPDVPPTDDAPEPPEQPFTKPGDVWILGTHRVVCGDSTEVTVYDTLLGEAKVDCVWTDPPYNVAVTGGTHDPRDTKNHGKGPSIANDNLSDSDFRQFLLSSFSAMWTAMKDGASIYVCHADTEGINFRTTFMEAGFFLHEVLIWVKQEFVFGRSDYHWQHEPILYGWRKGAAHAFLGARNQSTTWTVDRPMRSTMDHPTQKPIALPTKAIENSAPKGGLVLDPFGGSGSTLMACEYTGRKGRLIELDPKYVDVICRRWQEHTGSLPILESSSMTHDFTKD